MIESRDQSGDDSSSRDRSKLTAKNLNLEEEHTLGRKYIINKVGGATLRLGGD